jgi:hypothetical protein
MGINDDAEMLTTAQEEVVRLERELAALAAARPPFAEPSAEGAHMVICVVDHLPDPEYVHPHPIKYRGSSRDDAGRWLARHDHHYPECWFRVLPGQPQPVVATPVSDPSLILPDGVLQEAHARFHDQAGNMLGPDDCGWPHCQFWESSMTIAPLIIEWARRDQVEADSGEAFSGMIVNGNRLSWRELVAHEREEKYRLQAAARLLSDLDRSPHGRHEGDAEGQDPTGESQGNPCLTTGQIIGYDIGGRPYVVPEPRERGVIAAWRPTTPEPTDTPSGGPKP